MKKIAILAALLVAALAQAQDTHIASRYGLKSTAPVPLEFQGLRPGMARADAHDAYLERVRSWVDKEFQKQLGWPSQTWNDWDCNDRAGGTTVCLFYHRNPNVSCEFQAWFVDGKLAMAQWAGPTVNYFSLRDALKEKFGPPSDAAKHEYQNRMGAKTIGETLRWKSGGSSLELAEIGDRLDRYSVRLQDTALTGEFLKRYGGEPEI